MANSVSSALTSYQLPMRNIGQTTVSVSETHRVTLVEANMTIPHRAIPIGVGVANTMWCISNSRHGQSCKCRVQVNRILLGFALARSYTINLVQVWGRGIDCIVDDLREKLRVIKYKVRACSLSARQL